MNQTALYYSLDNGRNWIFVGFFSSNSNEAWDAQRAIQNGFFGRNVQFQQRSV